jgi:hypothetical protein
MKHYLVIAGSANREEPFLTVYRSKEDLQKRIDEDNDESIREENRPKYLQIKNADFDRSERIPELTPRYPEQYILEFTVVVPKPTKVVERYLIP